MPATQFADPRQEGGLRWLHYALAGILIIAALAVIGVLTYAGVLFVKTHLSKDGGAVPIHHQLATLPPESHAGAGYSPPASYDLNKFIVRIHNQGNTQTCWCQSATAVGEITWREYTGKSVGMAPDYVCFHIHGGVDNPTTIEDGAAAVQRYGLATLSAFPTGDADYSTPPSTRLTPAALTRHINYFQTVDVHDWPTWKYWVSQGQPLVLLIPVNNEFYGPNRVPVTDTSSGYILFWHFVVIYGYTPNYVRVLNSWSPGWGSGGKTTMTWNALANSGGIGVLLHFTYPLHQPPPKPRVDWITHWNAFAKTTGAQYVPTTYKGQSSEQATWYKFKPAQFAWSPAHAEIWHPPTRTRKVGFMTMPFSKKGAQGHYGYYRASLTTWPGKGYQPKFEQTNP